MKSGHILALCLTILGAFDFWVQYNFFARTDNDEYSWIMYGELIFIIPILGLLFHKRWSLVFLRVMLWLWIIATFYTGLVASNLNGSENLFDGMVGSLKMHWWQFLLFFGLLFYSKTDKVKSDFGVVEKKIAE